uniref:Uncharacterized protein n=1 Tax=Marseillevirus LCMAC101 TaxID=2506602 RepID=A0A481YRN3_9VIRU|nr:MAG: hypothetical protein LCMAC101_02250 [Marseillevirus LCMAC101]
MVYTTKVLSGRTYWYKDGKRIAAAKVPASVKSGKKNGNGKKPSGKKNGNGKKPATKKVPSMAQIQDDCNKATKAEVIEALNTLSKVELCKLVAQIPKAPKPISASMKKKIARYLALLKSDMRLDPRKCIGKPIPKCKGVYCSLKKDDWHCPEDEGIDIETIYAAQRM